MVDVALVATVWIAYELSSTDVVRVAMILVVVVVDGVNVH